jgi:hypothetical protein
MSFNSSLGAFSAQLSVSPQLRSFLPDECAHTCYGCGGSFQNTRKHHCRLCLRIFCDACSMHRTEVPPLLQPPSVLSTNTTRPFQLDASAVATDGRPSGSSVTRQHLGSLAHSIHSAVALGWQFLTGSGDDRRVCDRCFHRIQGFTFTKPLVLALINHEPSLRNLLLTKRDILVRSLSYLDMNDWGKVAVLDQSFRTAIRFLRRRLREITRQNFDWGEQQSVLNDRLLRQNAHLLINHNRYGLKCAQLQITPSLPPRQTPCAFAGCGSQCVSSSTRLANAMQAFLSLPRKHPYLTTVRQHLHTIDHADFRPFYPALVWLASSSWDAEQELLRRVSVSRDAAIEIFWVLRAQPHLDTLRMLVFSMIGTDVRKEIELSCLWVSAFTKFCDSSAEHPHFAFTHSITDAHPLLPGSTTLRVASIDLQSRNVLSSNAKPTVVDALLHDEETGKMSKHCFMFKPVCMFNDAAVMNTHAFLRQMRSYSDFPIPVYNVCPLTPESGLVVFVEEATTLRELEAEDETIVEYLSRHNEDLSYAAVRERFLKSCAYQCILSFVLGYGDRHNSNLLVTKDCRLFHIDFDHLFNNEPNVGLSFLRTPGLSITKGMNRVVRHHKEEFLGYCQKINALVRAQCEGIYWCLWWLLRTTALTKTTLQNHFITRVFPAALRNLKHSEIAVVSLLTNTTSSGYFKTLVRSVFREIAETGREML